MGRVLGIVYGTGSVQNLSLTFVWRQSRSEGMPRRLQWRRGPATNPFSGAPLGTGNVAQPGQSARSGSHRKV